MEMTFQGLGYKPGNLVFFEADHPIDLPTPSLLAVVKKIQPGIPSANQSIPFRLTQGGVPGEVCSFKPAGLALALHPPNNLGGRPSPCYDCHGPYLSSGINIFLIKSISVGQEQVIERLSQSVHLSYYADCIREGRLVYRRGLIGRELASMQLHRYLPNKLRFRESLWADLGLPQLR